MPPNSTTAPAEQTASQDQAVGVMQRYARTAADIYDGMPTFTAPPSVAGIQFPAPESEPAQPPVAEPSSATAPPTFRPRGIAEPASATTPSMSTTLADFPSAMNTDSGLAVGAPVGMVGGVLGAQQGGVGGGVPVIGPNAGGSVGDGLLSETSNPVTEANAMEAEQTALDGYAPMTRTGRRGEQDGQYRSRYTTADLVGALPPACPPVIGVFPGPVEDG